MNRVEEYQALLNDMTVPAVLEATVDRAIQRKRKKNRAVIAAAVVGCLLFGAIPFLNREQAVSPLVITVYSYGENGNMISEQLELGHTEEIGAELTLDEKYALYEAYGKIMQEANETYGRAMCLLPIEEINFCSVEEFRRAVFDYCEAANAPWVHVESPEKDPNFWMVAVRSTVIKEYKIDTVINHIDCAFAVEKNGEGLYEMEPKMAAVNTESMKGITNHAVMEEPIYTVTDEGRTVTVSQILAVHNYGQFACYTSVSASYTIDPATGNITAITNP